MKLITDENKAKDLAMQAISKMFNNPNSKPVQPEPEDAHKNNEIISINSVPDNLKSSNETVDKQITYNKGLSRQANHTLQKFNTYGVNTFIKSDKGNGNMSQNQINQNNSMAHMSLKSEAKGLHNINVEPTNANASTANNTNPPISSNNINNINSIINTINKPEDKKENKDLKDMKANKIDLMKEILKMNSKK